jgi:hypothetical protein
MSLIYYNSYDIFLNPKYKSYSNKVPGAYNFADYFEVFSLNITAIDRTNTIKTPLKTTVLPHLQLPEYKTQTTSFSDICDERASFLMMKAKHTGKKLAIMYSGGIDSTAVLCSLLKNCSAKDIKENIVVLLSHHSIYENEEFYYNHVIKNFNCVSSFRFPYFLGNDRFIFLSGENADQLFGSQVVTNFIDLYPFTDLLKNIDETKDKMINLFSVRLNGDKRAASLLFDKMRLISDSAPIPIDTAYKMLWWINFTTKWQSVYVRMLPYSQNKESIELEENYTTFFCTKEFQLWSMNNSDNLIGTDPKSSKYVAKKYIVDYNGDTSYYSKPKIGSLTNLVTKKETPMWIDENLNYGYEYPDSSLYNYDNDFMDLK